jgi:uncharacterized protein (DUF1501 family)
MGPAWSQTVVVVISEFGRTFRENGTRGTDHGHGTVYWVLGGSVRGGRMAGDQVAVERGTLNRDRDWPVLNEYRSLFGGLFKVVFGLDAARVDTRGTCPPSHKPDVPGSRAGKHLVETPRA